MRLSTFPLTVSQITSMLKKEVEGGFRDVWVEGEVSNLRPSPTGHYYFSLRDADAQLSAVFFRGKARFFLRHLREGNQVVCHGDITFYRERGAIQLVVDFLEPRGLGEYLLALSYLRRRLEEEGLFSPERKRPLPLLPKTIGVVTSIYGAAIRDIIKVIRDTYPWVHILVSPVSVQGEKAPQEICSAIESLNREGDVDVIILSRGGGAREDLYPFNTEEVARAVAGSRVPLVSAVGHETDVTLADLASDFRAPTPSAAANAVVCKAAALMEQVQRFREALLKLPETLLGLPRARLESLQAKLEGKSPAAFLNAQRLRLSHLSERLSGAATAWVLDKSRALDFARSRLMAAWDQCLVEKKDAVRLCGEKLEGLSPLAVLERGYAILITEEGTPVVDASQVVEGQRVSGILHRGRLLLKVERRQ